LFSGILVIPITGVLMKVYKCEPHDVDPSNKPGEYLSASLERGEDFECWTSLHYQFAWIGAISLFIYIPIAIRFIRVDKKLESLEVKGLHLFDWKSDIINSEDRKHEMSVKDTKAERASFIVGVLLSMGSTFIDDEFISGVSDVVVQSVFVVCTMLYPSYFDRRTNKLALLLAWLTLYLYLASERSERSERAVRTKTSNTRRAPLGPFEHPVGATT